MRSVDVVPTIARELGIQLPWSEEGRPIQEGGTATGQVKVFDGASGDFVTLPFTDFVRERGAALRRMIRLFGADDGGAGLFAAGPDGDLLGRRVAQLEVADRAAGQLNLDSTELLVSFRTGSPTVPSFVTGTSAGQ